MDQDQEKQSIERKLATCRDLEREFPDGEMAKMIRELEEELRQQLRDWKTQDRISRRLWVYCCRAGGLGSCVV